LAQRFKKVFSDTFSILNISEIELYASNLQQKSNDDYDFGRRSYVASRFRARFQSWIYQY